MVDIKVKQAPLGVKIISIIYYIASVMLILSAIAIFVKGASMSNAIAKSLGPLGVGFLGSLISGLAIFLGIILLAFSILDFFIGRGLWKLQNWARILVAIF